MKVCIWILSIRMSLLLMMLIAVPGIVPVRCIIVRHLANMTIANR